MQEAEIVDRAIRLKMEGNTKPEFSCDLRGSERLPSIGITTPRRSWMVP